MRNLLIGLAAASMVATPALADPGHRKDGRHKRDRVVVVQQQPVVVYRQAPRYRAPVVVQRRYVEPYGYYGQQYGYGRTYGYTQPYSYGPAYTYPYNYRYGQRYTGAHRYWRGNDGRYYCRRDNGTVGVLVGAGLGAILGRSIDQHGERATGTILGGAIGAILGREILRGNVRCR